MLTKLEAQRRRQRMTLTQVANAAGCSTSYVHHVEHGTRNPSETVARKLAKAVGLPAAEWKTIQIPI
jgi:transcriptional regulator with XRE-family HTH domain